MECEKIHSITGQFIVFKYVFHKQITFKYLLYVPEMIDKSVYHSKSKCTNNMNMIWCDVVIRDDNKKLLVSNFLETIKLINKL